MKASNEAEDLMSKYTESLTNMHVAQYKKSGVEEAAKIAKIRLTALYEHIAKLEESCSSKCPHC